MSRQKDIVIKRIYDPVSKDDGYRVLIDRLWPRGMKKEDAKLDEWNKLISPSGELRKWFDHRGERYHQFIERYEEELSAQEPELERLRKIAGHQRLTLLYASREPELNHAQALLHVLKK